MAEEPKPAANRPESLSVGDRLDSWKEIAAHLKRDVTTVQRWEKREALPVHRHLHAKRDSVYAFKSDVDRWWQERRNHLTETASVDSATARDHRRRSAHAVWDLLRPTGRDRYARLAWSLAVTFCVVASVSTGALAILYFRIAPSAKAEVRFPVLPPEQASFGTVSLAPDGRQLAFTASTGEGRLLWIRPLDSLTAYPLRGTEDATFPFWSPDGLVIGFFAEGKLKTINVSGGTARVVCDAPAGRGGTWNREGTILFSPGRESAVFRVPASGGSATPVTSVERPRHRGHLWPEFLPDGRHFLYLADSTEPEHHVIYVGEIDSTDRKPLTTAASNAAYTRDGYLLFARDRRLVAQPFDVNRFELTGEPLTLVDQLHHQLEFDHKVDFSVAANVMAYRSIASSGVQLVWRDRAGRQLDLIDDSAQYFDPTLSPNEKRFAVVRSEPPSKRFGFGLGNWTSDIWIFDVSSGAASRFTFDPGAEWEPVWSPDGTRVVYASNRTGVLDLYQKAVSLTGSDELLLHSGRAKHAESWSPDGRFILYSTLEPKTGWDLWMLPMFGDRQPVTLMQSEFTESNGQVSPDGRWLAYTSTESGRSEVYVRSFPALMGKWQISNHGGGDPRWRSDGKELFYLAADRRLMAVAVVTGTAFEPGVTRPLFDTQLQHVQGDARNHYDVSRDGSRFLVMKPVADTRSSPYTIVVNWTTGRPQ